MDNISNAVLHNVNSQTHKNVFHQQSLQMTYLLFANLEVHNIVTVHYDVLTRSTVRICSLQ